MILRKEYLESFQVALLPVGMLDRFKVTGVLATWWDSVRDEIQTISARGFEELVDGWIDLIQDVIEDTETKKNELFDPFEHKLVVKLLPDYLQQIEDRRAEIAHLEAEKEAFERQTDEEEEESSEEGEEESRPNYAKVLEEQLKEIKGRLKTEKENADLLAEKEDLEENLAPYKEVVAALKAAKKTLKDLSKALLQVLRNKRVGLSSDDCRALVLELTREDLERVLCRYAEEHRQEVRAAVENLWNKDGVSLQAIQARRDAARARLDEFLKGLGYVR
jgi:DNA repair exonuclease SbcCD ATPase subunit